MAMAATRRFPLNHDQTARAPLRERSRRSEHSPFLETSSVSRIGIVAAYAYAYAYGDPTREDRW